MTSFLTAKRFLTLICWRFLEWCLWVVEICSWTNYVQQLTSRVCQEMCTVNARKNCKHIKTVFWKKMLKLRCGKTCWGKTYMLYKEARMKCGAMLPHCHSMLKICNLDKATLNRSLSAHTKEFIANRIKVLQRNNNRRRQLFTKTKISKPSYLRSRDRTMVMALTLIPWLYH